jgi:hypothetical protein
MLNPAAGPLASVDPMPGGNYSVRSMTNPVAVAIFASQAFLVHLKMPEIMLASFGESSIIAAD